MLVLKMLPELSLPNETGNWTSRLLNTPDSLNANHSVAAEVNLHGLDALVSQ